MTYVVASSAGWPGRFIGTCLPKFATASCGIVAGMSGVQIGPGATAFARIPFSASICARPAVKFWIAPFVVAYASSAGLGVSALIEAVLMIELPGFMWGTAAFVR